MAALARGRRRCRSEGLRLVALALAAGSAGAARALGAASAPVAEVAVEATHDLSKCDLGFVVQGLERVKLPEDVAKRMVASRQTLQDIMIFTRRLHELTEKDDEVTSEFLEDAHWITRAAQAQSLDMERVLAAMPATAAPDASYLLSCAGRLLTKWLGADVFDRMRLTKQCLASGVSRVCQRALLQELSALDAMLQDGPPAEADAQLCDDLAAQGGCAREPQPPAAAPAAAQAPAGAGGRSVEAAAAAAPSTAASPAPSPDAQAAPRSKASDGEPRSGGEPGRHRRQPPARPPASASAGKAPAAKAAPPPAPEAPAPAALPRSPPQTNPALLLLAAAELLGDTAWAERRRGLAGAKKPQGKACDMKEAEEAMQAECNRWIGAAGRQPQGLFPPCAMRNALRSMRELASTASRMVVSNSCVRTRWVEALLSKHTRLGAKLAGSLVEVGALKAKRENYDCARQVAKRWSAPAVVKPLRAAQTVTGRARRDHVSKFAIQVCLLDPRLEMFATQVAEAQAKWRKKHAAS